MMYWFFFCQKYALYSTAFCTSLYSGALWAERLLSSLRVQYNNAFRALLRLPRFYSVDARVDTLLRKKITLLLTTTLGSNISLLLTITVRNECSKMQHLISNTLPIQKYVYVYPKTVVTYMTNIELSTNEHQIGV